VDKNDFVSSASMLAGTYLSRENPEVVKRWVNEVQEKLSSNNFNVHYHGLILMHAIKKADPVALAKLLISMTRANIKSHLAYCQLIRFIKEALSSLTLDSQVERVLLDFLEGCLHKSNDMVVYEAAKALCERENAGTQEL
jgi:coatomer protein complex subunit gamma